MSISFSEEKQTQIDNALKDTGFFESLVAMDSPEKVQAAFSSKGIDLTLSEITELARLLSQPKEGELTEDSLEDVAGGYYRPWIPCYPVGWPRKPFVW